MASQTVDYKAVLRDLEERRAVFNQAIDGAIHNIKHIVAMTATPQEKTLFDALRSTPASKALNPFKNMSLGAASMKMLVEKDGLTNQQIADALDAAGFVHGSSNFPNLVGTALHRLKGTGKSHLRREHRKWYLGESRKDVAV